MQQKKIILTYDEAMEQVENVLEDVKQLDNNFIVSTWCPGDILRTFHCVISIKHNQAYALEHLQAHIQLKYDCFRITSTSEEIILDIPC